MRIVTLEEHYTVSSLVRLISPEAIARGGFPPAAKTGPQMKAAELDEIGPIRLAAMDAAGISQQVLSLSGPGAELLSAAEGPSWASAANDALAAAVARHPDRFAGFAHLPLTAPEAAADELERAVTRLGFRGALVNGTTDGLFLDDPRFAPILARAEALDVPIYIHPGIPPAPVRDAYYSNLPGDLGFMLGIAGWGWHSETAIHVLRLVLSGALDRHPRLQIIIGHMGEGLAGMLARCDSALTIHTRKQSHRTVSETLLQQLHVTTSGFFTLPPFELALHTFGIDRMMFSIDYPFSSNQVGRAFLDSLPIAPADLAKIAHGNADRLLKLTV